MSNSMFIGLAVGTVMGMCLASKNDKVAKKVREAKTVVEQKIGEVASEMCPCQSPDSQQNG